MKKTVVSLFLALFLLAPMAGHARGHFSFSIIFDAVSLMCPPPPPPPVIVERYVYYPPAPYYPGYPPCYYRYPAPPQGYPHHFCTLHKVYGPHSCGMR